MAKKFLLLLLILTLGGCSRFVERKIIPPATKGEVRIVEHFDNGDYLVTASFIKSWLSYCAEYRDKTDCEDALTELLVAEYPDGTWRVKAQLVEK